MQRGMLTIGRLRPMVGVESMLRSDVRGTLELEANERWYLVHTPPNNERRAKLHLGAQGFRTHFPTIQKTVRHARQLRTVRAPLFPRYVFLILDLGGYRCATLVVSFRCSTATVVRFPYPKGLWKRSSRTQTKPTSRSSIA